MAEQKFDNNIKNNDVWDDYIFRDDGQANMLKCKMCNHVPKIAYDMNQNVCCRYCVNNIISNNNNNNNNDNNESKFNINNIVTAFIGKLGVYCPTNLIEHNIDNEPGMFRHTPNGEQVCKWEGTVNEITNHLDNQCDFVRIKCHYDILGCNAQIVKSQLSGHIKQNHLKHDTLLINKITELIKSNHDKDNEIKSLKDQINNMERQLNRVLNILNINNNNNNNNIEINGDEKMMEINEKFDENTKSINITFNKQYNIAYHIGNDKDKCNTFFGTTLIDNNNKRYEINIKINKYVYNRLKGLINIGIINIGIIKRDKINEYLSMNKYSKSFVYYSYGYGYHSRGGLMNNNKGKPFHKKSNNNEYYINIINDLNINDEIDLFDASLGKYKKAKILQKMEDGIKIHWIGYSKKYDEFIQNIHYNNYFNGISYPYLKNDIITIIIEYDNINKTGLLSYKLNNIFLGNAFNINYNDSFLIGISSRFSGNEFEILSFKVKNH